MDDNDKFLIADGLETTLWSTRQFVEELEDKVRTTLEGMGYFCVEGKATFTFHGDEFTPWEVWVHPHYLEVVSSLVGEPELELDEVERLIGKPVPKGAIVLLDQRYE